MDDPEPMLFAASQLEAEALLDAVGHEAAHKHSAGYLQQRNPRLFDAIALALGYGVPVSIIAVKCGVGENTVRAVAMERSALISARLAPPLRS